MSVSWRGLPLAGKVFLVCTGLAVVVAVVASLVLYRGASNCLREQVRRRLESLAATAALQIDSALVQQVRSRRDESSDAYRRLQGTLRAIQQANPEIQNIYAVRRNDRRSVWRFVVDLEKDWKPVSHVAERLDGRDRPEIRRALYGPVAENSPTADRWGTWLSGYAPIRNRAACPEVVLALDMSIDELRAQQSALRRSAFNNFLVALLFANLLSLLVTKAIVARVRIFTDAAHRVRGGDLDFRVSQTGDDEIDEFANSFNHMIVALRENRERLMEQSNRDFLTGLHNHRYFHERLAAEIDRAERFGHRLCLVILDVDRFKSINDTLGHPVGDSILRQLAGVLRENVRSMDVAARYGGDEFAIIFPETDTETGKLAAERIRQIVEKYHFAAVPAEQLPTLESALDDQPSVTVTVTMGLAGHPDHHRTRDGLVMAADIALCRAKHVARNNVCTYDPSIVGRAHADPHELYQALQGSDVAAIRSLAAAGDAKDRYTHGHSERVTEYALQLAEALGTNPEMMDAVKVAGLLHDLGKIGVPDSILNKRGGLTQEERKTVMRHPSDGGNILRRAPQLDLVVPAVLFHHERWDGSGYPDGLSGDSIPLMARILAIADAFDAMTSDRPYRKAMSVAEALSEIRANAGGQFDPELVELFIAGVSAQLLREAA